MTSQVAEDFILKFHSLGGITLAERRKNFFKLLHQNASLKGNIEVLETIATNLKTKTFLESLFKLDFLIYFRRTKELYDLLKEGNDIVICKIITHDWFFEEAFTSIKAEELVNEILPCMSFSVRMKVLRKLSKYLDGEKFDEIYDAVEIRYGKFLASNFFIGCSPKKLRKILDNSVTLNSKQFMILYKKDPELIKHLIDVTGWKYKYSLPRGFLKYIYNEDRDLYSYVEKKLQLDHLKLGRRLTKKFVHKNKNNIIEKPAEYNSFLHMKVVVRKLGWKAEQLFRNTLPPTIENYSLSSVSELLNYFPKKFHYCLMTKIIESHYNIKYIDRPSFINERILGYIPDNEERALLAKVKVDAGDDSYIKYLLPKDSIPKIKEKINFTSDIYVRRLCIETLVETCHINKDTAALLEVIKYFISRHKNDDVDIHMRFIQHIESYFGYKNFNHEIWNQFNDLLAIHMLKFNNDLDIFQKIQTRSLTKFNKGISECQKLSYLEFLFNNKEPIDEFIAEYLNKNNIPGFGSYNPDFEKYLLLYAINNSENIYTDNDKKAIWHKSLIMSFNNWNYYYYYYPNDQLSFCDYPVLEKIFNNILKNDKYKDIDPALVKLFKKNIFTTEENKYRNEYLQIYWERHDIFGRTIDYIWFLKYEPTQIVNNFEKFVKHLFNFDLSSIVVTLDRTKSRYVWKSRSRGRKPQHSSIQFERIPPHRLQVLNFLKKYSHLQLDNTLIDFCVSKLNDNTYLDPKSKFVMFLSVMIEPEKFAELADSFKPTNKTLDLKNETEVKRYNLQCSFGQNFKNTKSHQVLSSLLNYCAGDYFKYAMRSLYSIIYRTPENLLPQYLDYLSKKAVSVRKHALYFTCELTSITKTEEMLRILNNRKDAESLRKYLLKSTIKYFIKNPTDEIFEMVKSNMNFINKTDEESLQMIVDSIAEVPKKYKVPYIEYVWEFVEKTVDIWQNQYPLKLLILDYSNDNDMIKEFPLDYILKIIQKHFLAGKSKGLDYDTMNSFIFCSLNNREEKTVILEIVLDIIKNKERSTMLEFFRDWYVKLMETNIDVKYLEPLLNWFTQQIHVMNDFSDYMKLFFLRAKLEGIDHHLDEFAKRTLDLLNDLIKSYGPYIINIFCEEFKSSIYYFIKQPFDLYGFYLNWLRNHPTPLVAILIINVVTAPHSGSVCTEAFNNILRKIMDVDDDGVQFNLKYKFKDYVVPK